jgi:hypothetical protein
VKYAKNLDKNLLKDWKSLHKDCVFLNNTNLFQSFEQVFLDNLNYLIFEKQTLCFINGRIPIFVGNKSIVKMIVEDKEIILLKVSGQDKPKLVWTYWLTMTLLF